MRDCTNHKALFCQCILQIMLLKKVNCQSFFMISEIPGTAQCVVFWNDLYLLFSKKIGFLSLLGSRCMFIDLKNEL